MQKRYMVFGLSVVLALALAVPALGGPSNPIASISAGAKSIANKALKKAKKAQATANSAQTAANGAQATANSAQSEAKKAQTTADKAQTAADKAQATGEKAQTTADKAQTSANKAQTTADGAAAAAAAAQATANSKLSAPENVDSGATESNSSSPKIKVASCPAGTHATGGGFVSLGATNEITPVISQQYGNGWLIDFTEIGAGTASNWSIAAEVSCGAGG